MMKKFIILFLALFIQQIELKNQSYYDILGVSRNASPKEIKKKYRKLVKEYHPDNNKERENWARKKFIDVTKAYETLSDPEKKRIYDMGGEEAVDEAEQRQNQGQQHGEGFGGFQQGFGGGFGGFGGGFNFEDIFEGAFGGQQQGRRGRRGGQRFHFNGGDFGEQEDDGFFQKKKKKKEKVNLNECKNFIELEDSILPNLSTLKENWNIFFYTDSEYDERQFKFVQELCISFGEYLKIAGIDCSEHQNICNKLGVHSFPTYRLYYSEGRKIDITLYDGLKTSFIVQQNLNVMENNIIKFTQENYIEIVKANFNKPILILFTKRKNSSLMYRSLANQFKDKIVFSEIHHQNLLSKKFNIKSLPTLLLLTDALNYQGIVFEKEINKRNLINFFNQHAFSKKEESYVMELTKERVDLGNCGKKDKSFCVIIVVNENKFLNEIRNKLKQLKIQYENDNVTFFYLKGSNLNKMNFKKEFGENELFIIRGKREKYTPIEGSSYNFEVQTIANKIDDLLGGGLGDMKSFNNLKNVFNQLLIINLLKILFLLLIYSLMIMFLLIQKKFHRVKQVESKKVKFHVLKERMNKWHFYQSMQSFLKNYLMC